MASVDPVAGTVDLLSRELDEDYVEVWKIAWHLRRMLPSAGPNEIRIFGEQVLIRLVASGALLSDVNHNDGRVTPWAVADPVAEAMRRWDALEGDPNMGDVGWL